MKKLLLLFATICSLTAKSQTSVYHPFPDSNAVWSGVRSSWGGGLLSTSNYKQYINGDTTINGYLYHQIHEIGVAKFDTSAFTPYSYGFIGGYRENASHQIFCYDIATNTEMMLYDFNVVVGDSVMCYYGTCYGMFVSSIDSVFDGINYRRRFIVQDTTWGCSNCFHSMIEGIGSMNGLFSGFGHPFEGYNELYCFAQNGIVRYINDTTQSCNLITSLHENTASENVAVTISPNPFSNKLNFSSNNKNNSEIIIYDIVSRKILQQKFITSISLNTEQLAKGIYLYEVKFGNGLYKTGKIVKD